MAIGFPNPTGQPETFPVAELPFRVKTYLQQTKKIRNPNEFDTRKCPLMEIVQYRCDAGATIRCDPVVRLFRKCREVTIEVTGLEEA